MPDLIRRVEGYLHDLKYSQRTINSHKAVWRELALYARERDVGFFTASLGHDFLCDRHQIVKALSGQRTTAQRRASRSMAMLCDFHLHGVVFRQQRIKNRDYPAQFAKLFGDCLAAMKKRGLAPAAMRIVENNLLCFSTYLAVKGIGCFSNVRSPDIQEYILTLSHYVKHAITCTMYRCQHIYD